MKESVLVPNPSPSLFSIWEEISPTVATEAGMWPKLGQIQNLMFPWPQTLVQGMGNEPVQVMESFP